MLPQFEELLNRHHKLIIELIELHSGRPYHNWQHILAILALASRFPHLINDVEAFFWMAVFHDVIYQSDRLDNEERSATFARERLDTLVSETRLKLICIGISSTAKHDVPNMLSPTDRQDVAFFLDCDLSILGSDRDTFKAYDTAIRQEYAWVSAEQWRSGRVGVMKKFLARKPLYFTIPMQHKFELSARQNMESLVNFLSISQGIL
jgi:predicted metal-dependent HD superfamily phosphohydrolase